MKIILIILCVCMIAGITSAQEVDTPSSTGGKSPAFVAKDKAQVMIKYGISEERFVRLQEELKVTDKALAIFFYILDKEEVPRKDLKATLQAIAEQYNELLQRLDIIQSEDPQVVEFKTRARQAIEDGEFDKAETLLNQAEQRDMEAIAELKATIQQQQEALEKRQLSAAETNAENARLQEIQLQYAKAAEYYHKAATLLPAGHEKTRGEYLNAAGFDYHRVARYADALPLFEQSLAIRQEIGDKAGEGTTLNNLATTAYAGGDYVTALTYLEQSLAIRQEIGDIAGMCATLFNMGHIHLQNDEMPQAIVAWVTVYRLAKPRNIAQALEALENLAQHSGLPEQLGVSGGLEAWEALSQQMEDEDSSSK